MSNCEEYRDDAAKETPVLGEESCRAVVLMRRDGSSGSFAKKDLREPQGTLPIPPLRPG